MSAAGTLLVALMALSEMAVGLIIAALPSIGALLIGAPIEGSGLMLARMLGVAVLVVGLTWWLARGEQARSARIVPGFLIYNFGVGALFALAATSASRPLVPWILAAVHVGAGAAYCAVRLKTPSPQDASA